MHMSACKCPYILCVRKDPCGPGVLWCGYGFMNSRCLCPLYMSDCVHICVSVNFVCLCVPLSLCAWYVSKGVFLFYLYIHVLCLCVMCPGVPTTVHLVGGEGWKFCVYPCVCVSRVCCVALGLRVCVLWPSLRVCVCVCQYYPHLPRASSLYISVLRAFLFPGGCDVCIFRVCVSLGVPMCIACFYGQPRVTGASVPLHVPPRPPVGV